MNLGEGESPTVEFSPTFPYQGAFFLRRNQQGSMLKPIQRAREHRPSFVPDDLLVVHEPDPQQFTLLVGHISIAVERGE